MRGPGRRAEERRDMRGPGRRAEERRDMRGPGRRAEERRDLRGPGRRAEERRDLRGPGRGDMRGPGRGDMRGPGRGDMRGPGRLLLWVCAVLELLSPAGGVKHAVYWNSSNPRFLKEDYTVHVAINDHLEIYCPHYDSRVPEDRIENFVLYMVNREGYEGCYESPKALKRWECNRPHAPSGPIKFSEKIHRFTPFSLGTEFREGQDYYYISVPESGSVGECLKLRLSVCCRPTAKPITEVPKSQPRGGEPGDPWGRSSSPPSCSFSGLLLLLCLLF